MTHWLLLLIAAATGAAVMVVELMTVRLMAPWYGQSQIVWTNVIGVVLAALAAGQWLGGRWTVQKRSSPIVALVLLAGALSFVVPDVIRLLAPMTLPPGLQLDEAWPFVTYGSLLVVMIAVGLPMAALGAVTPWLVRLSREAPKVPGRIAGAMLGAGTLGSLFGTFGTTYFMLPRVGSAWSVRLAGSLLICVALLVWLLSRERVSAMKLVFLLIPLVPRAFPVLSTDESVLASVETPYQDARVELDSDGTRLLRINEGLDSFHSAYRPGMIWTNRYFDAFVAPALVSPFGADGLQRVLILGFGAGTMARQIHEISPDSIVSGVELDKRLVQLGIEWFGLPESIHVDSGVDARVALRYSSAEFGCIIVDSYSQQIYVPAHLCTMEFFQELRSHLLEGGIAALNLGGRTREDPVVSAISSTFACVFPDPIMARVPGTRNMILMGVRGGAFDHMALDERLKDIEMAVPDVRNHLGWMVDAGTFGAVEPSRGGGLLRDGNAPIESMAHAGWRASTSWDS